MASAGVCVPVTVSDTSAEVVAPDVALARLVTCPASTSAWITTYVAEQVSVAFGARPPAGRAGQDTEAILSSLTLTGSVSVTLPVLVTV